MKEIALGVYVESLIAERLGLLRQEPCVTEIYTGARKIRATATMSSPVSNNAKPRSHASRAIDRIIILQL